MIQHYRMFDAVLLDATAAGARRESLVLELQDGAVVTMNVTIVEQTATLTGTLRIEVANGDAKTRQREIDTGGDLLPWQLYGPIGSTVPTLVTVTNDEIIISSGDAYPIKVTPGFRWLRLVATRSAGVGMIDVIAGVGIP